MFVSDISVNLERIQLLVELKICFFCSGMNSVHSVPEFTDILQNYMSNTVLVVSVTSL